MATSGPGKQFSSHDYYRALFENPRKNCVLLLDGTGRIIEVNRAFLLSFGYDEADLIGQNFSMLFTEEDRGKYLPMREVNMVLDEGQSFDNNYLVNKNNVRTWVSGESVLVTNQRGERNILKIIQNIHVQKESEYSILTLNRFNESILATIDDAVVVLDQELKIAKANRSFYRLFEGSDTPVPNIDLPELLDTLDKKNELRLAITAALGTGDDNPPFQLDFEDPPGVSRTFEVSCTRLESHPDKFNVLVVFHDITSQKNQERQREDILNFVVHELRNPLTNIILNIGWMNTQMSQEKLDDYAEFAERAARNAERLKKLINELYKSTKLISGNYDLQAAPCELDECIAECIDSMQRAHPDFTIEQRGRVNAKVLVDKEKIIQVINNYLSNAIKYSGQNKNILVTSGVGDGLVTVSVQDWGKGIPPKELPLVFNRFYRAEKTRDLEGLGIGLFLCRQIIEAHHGRTWVESAEGKGSTFYFSLPVVDSL